MGYATLVEALESAEGDQRQGFNFLGSDGKETSYTWDALHKEAKNRAAHFRAKGLKKGDRLALVMPDGVDFIPSFLGAAYAGIVPVPLYPPLSLGKLDSYIESLVAIMTRAETTWLATNARLEQVLWSAAGKVKGLNGVITAETLRTEAPAGASRAAEKVTPDDVVFLQFTSGSTATPKGVVVTHDSLRANAEGVVGGGIQASPERDHGVCWLPLYHDMGLIGHGLAPVFLRIPVTFIPTLSFVRNATLWLDVLHEKRGTITFAPNFAYALAAKRAKPHQMAKWDLSCVRVFGCGAEPINPSTIRMFTEKFSACGMKPEAMFACYGMAEATLCMSHIGLDETLSTDIIDRTTYQSQRRAEPAHVSKLEGNHALEFVSCGKAMPGHELGAFDEEGKRLKDREVGELWFKGPSVARGYFQDPELSERIFGGGWLRTGDLGYLVNGNVYITGRKKDLIIVNGRNYDPQRLEWIADEVPEVRRGSTVAFSVPGASSEEVVVAVESRTSDKAALMEAVKQRIIEQLQLAVAEVVIAAPGSLPKTSSGKIQRQKTRAQYLDKTVGIEGSRTLGGNGDKLTLAKHVALSFIGRARHRVRRVTTQLKSVFS
jgi:fatty-acyl-CoA synthase